MGSSNQEHSKLTSEVALFFKKLDMCRAVKISPGRNMENGISDFLICYRGKYIAIELKTLAHPWDPKSLQADFFEEVRDAGGRTAVCYSLEEVKAVMA